MFHAFSMAPVLFDDPTPMGSLLSQLSTIGTSVFSWVTSVATTIVNQPILLLTTGFLVVGGAVGIFGRLLSKN